MDETVWLSFWLAVDLIRSIFMNVRLKGVDRLVSGEGMKRMVRSNCRFRVYILSDLPVTHKHANGEVNIRATLVMNTIEDANGSR